MTENHTLKAVEYDRMSRKKLTDELERDWRERQAANTQEMAERAGATITLRLEDTKSASIKAQRSGFQELLRVLPQFDMLVLYAFDRLLREPRHLEDLIDVLEKNPHIVVIADYQKIDLGTPEGRMLMRVVTATKKYELEMIAWRQTQKRKQERERGDWCGYRGFGHTKEGVDAAQARMIQAAGDRILAGTRAWVIAEDWNRAGSTTSRGNAWTAEAVTLLFCSPRIAGYLVHWPDRKGPQEEGIARDRKGKPIHHPAREIIAPAKWTSIVTELRKRGAAKAAKQPKRAHLLSGHLRCGRCNDGTMLAGTRVMARGRATHRYICGQCAMSIDGPRLEQMVREFLFAHAEAMRAAKLVTVPYSREAELENAVARRSKVNEDVALGRTSRANGNAQLAILDGLIEEMQSERAAWIREHVTGEDLAGLHDIRRTWVTSTFGQQRTSILTHLNPIDIAPARPGPGFDPSRVTITPAA